MCVTGGLSGGGVPFGSFELKTPGSLKSDSRVDDASLFEIGNTPVDASSVTTPVMLLPNMSLTLTTLAAGPVGPVGPVGPGKVGRLEVVFSFESSIISWRKTVFSKFCTLSFTCKTSCNVAGGPLTPWSVPRAN